MREQEFEAKSNNSCVHRHKQWKLSTVQLICRSVDPTQSVVKRQAGADSEWQWVTTNQCANSSNNKAFKEFTKRQKACIQANGEHFEHLMWHWKYN